MKGKKKRWTTDITFLRVFTQLITLGKTLAPVNVTLADKCTLKNVGKKI